MCGERSAGSVPGIASGRRVHPLVAVWAGYASLLDPIAATTIEVLERERQLAEAGDRVARPAFRAQDAALLADGLHYETRIAERAVLTTREQNPHDLFNALVWLRHPQLKLALNARQVADIAEVGPKRRTRGQCAMTHFDEAGAIVWCADPALVMLWDRHDWVGVFLRERAAWGTRIAITVFGHALLERQFAGSDALSTTKAIVVHVCADDIVARCVEGSIIAQWAQAEALIAAEIRDGRLLTDPQELRPLPLVGIPGWHAEGASTAFYRDAPCFRPLRPGRRYPPAFVPSSMPLR